MNIFYVSNPKGVQQYITTDLAALDAALLAAVQDLRCTPLAALQKLPTLNPDLPALYTLLNSTRGFWKVQGWSWSRSSGETMKTRFLLTHWVFPLYHRRGTREKWFTDGSTLKRRRRIYIIPATSGWLDDSERIGAGVYNAAAFVRLRKDPVGVGATNTITRAELIAILVALQQSEIQCSDIMIATDSQASLYMINKQLYEPRKHAECKHKTLLAEIVSLLIRRAQNGYKTTLAKVKCHIGIEGNEEADKLAGEAVTGSRCDQEQPLGYLGLMDMIWPIKTDTQAAPDRPRIHWQVANLTHDVKKKTAPTCQTGLTNKTVYVKAWADVQPYTLSAASNAF